MQGVTHTISSSSPSPSPTPKRNTVMRMDSFHLERQNTGSTARATVPSLSSVFEMLNTGDPGMDSHISLIKSTDWGSTSIGPISTWPSEMSTILYLIMLAPQPRCLMLGTENLLLYNVAYGRLIRDHHPNFFGKPIGELEEWKELRPDMEMHRERARSSGRTQVIEDFSMPMMNHGRLEEVYLSFTIVLQPPPLIGFYMCFEEKTEFVLREKRRSTIKELSETWSKAESLQELWMSVLGSMEDREMDFPFAAVYSARTNPESKASQDGSEDDLEERTYHLEGVVGKFEGTAMPMHFMVPDSTSGAGEESLKQAVESKTQILIQLENESLPESWSKSSLNRGFGDACTEAVVFPSSLTRYQRVEAVMVIGLATRRPFDDAHQAYIQQLQREFADVVNSIVATTEASCRRKENLRRHQLERDLLAKELALRQREAELATSQVKRVLGVIDKVDVGIFEYAATGELIQANSGYHRLSGYPNDLPKDTKFRFFDLVRPEDRGLVESSWESILRGESKRFELRYKNSTPEGQWVLAACMPVLDKSGVVTGVIGCVTDIAAQKSVERDAIERAQALERAKASDERFLRLTQAAPVGILIADTEKGVQYVNDSWFNLSGHPVVPVDQINWNNALLEEDLELANEGWQAMLRGEKVQYSLRLKKLWYDSEGQPRGPAWMMVKAFPEFDENGKVVQVMGISIDISHLKFSENIHRLRMEEAVEAKRQQENFIDMTSHEIRNPLSAVVHCADSISDSLQEMTSLANDLASKIKDPPVKEREIKRLFELIESSVESVDTISTCSEHQKRIVTDVLTLSKLDSKLLQINPSSIRASSLLNNIGKMFEVEAERVGVKMKLSADKSIRDMKVDWVQLDSGRILQILINLTTNAIKFTKNEARDRVVKVVMGASKRQPQYLPVDFTLSHNAQDQVYESPKLENDDDFYLWFTVTDSGRGMTAEEKSRIFSRFGQASPKTFNEYGGSGLGLFISRELVELQGGEIGVASEAGKGSTFAFFIQTNPAPTPIPDVLSLSLISVPIKSDSYEEVKKDSGIQINITEIFEEPQTKLLVVEDNHVNARVLKKQLTKHGYEVYLASNGQEALDFLTSPHEPQVDAILMDVEMPVMDGITAAKKIRELERRTDLMSYGDYSSSDTNLNEPSQLLGRTSRGNSSNSILSLGSVADSIEGTRSRSASVLSRIPIIAISANARPEQKSEAILAGMDDAISKPFRVVDLTPRVDHLVSWARSRAV